MLKDGGSSNKFILEQYTNHVLIRFQLVCDFLYIVGRYPKYVEIDHGVSSNLKSMSMHEATYSTCLCFF